jgi:hypothetical protein
MSFSPKTKAFLAAIEVMPNVTRACAYRKSYPRGRRPALNAANQTIDPRFARSNGRAPEIHAIGRGLVRAGQRELTQMSQPQ